jgi:hypothetical protein
MKTRKRATSAVGAVGVPEAPDGERSEAYLAKPAHERAFGALLVANRVIKQHLARYDNTSASETAKSRY